MNITYNDISSPSNLVTLTDVPNILKVEDYDGGRKTVFNLDIEDVFNSVTTADGQWYIRFMDDTVTNVLDPANAINKSFYVGNSVMSIAASIARAFRNCSSVIANYVVEVLDSGTVRFTARGVGSLIDTLSNVYESNIPPAYLSASAVDGSADSPLNGALIDVDVFTDEEYVTTLEKNWYNGEAAFNMSPVLTTLSEVGHTVPYTFKISSIKNGEYSLLGNVDTNYTTVGYMCNQGMKCIPLSTGLILAQNVSRGTPREFENNTLLYIYKPEIDISAYVHNTAGMSVTIDYLDSAFDIIGTTSFTWHNTSSSEKLKDFSYGLNLTVAGKRCFDSAFYIDLSLGVMKVRYNVIKPLKATEYSQRILWRNSYGGVSFFDFTGQRSETRDVGISTYQKNIFDYYTDPMNELDKVYDNEVTYTVTLKSHLFEHDGKYIFNDLIQSTKVWTEINGQDYAIIIDSVSVDETDRNDIYEATVKYRYSQESSLV